MPPSGLGRVQEELDRVLGPGQLPRPEDQRALPYTSAVLHETQRYITLLPHVPRCTTADIQLGGYLLPKVPSYFFALAGWTGDFLGLIFTCLGGGGGGQELPRVALCPFPSLQADQPTLGPLYPIGHPCDPSADLGAPGQDAMGDPKPVQPTPLPGCRRAVREAGRLPAFLHWYLAGPQPPGSAFTSSCLPLSPPGAGLAHYKVLWFLFQAAGSALEKAWP